MFDGFFGVYNPPPPPLDQWQPLRMLYMFIATYHCPMGFFGVVGGGITNKLKDTRFIFSMTNITILSIFRACTWAEGIP